MLIVTALLVGGPEGVWVFQQPTDSSVPTTEPSGLTTVTRMPWESSLSCQGMLVQKINVHPFIAADGRVGCNFSFYPPNNVCCHAVILAISVTDEHIVSCEIFAKHDGTLRTTPQWESVCACLCVHGCKFKESPWILSSL